MKTKKIAITVLGIAIILLSGIILMVYIRNQNKQDYNDLGTLLSEEGSNQSNETLHEIDTDLGLEESNYNQVEDETLGFESNSQNNDNTSSDSDLNTSLSTNSNANKNNNTNSNTNKNTNTNSNKNS